MVCAFVRVRVCVSSVTLMHPAKDIGWNEMQFGRALMLSQVTLCQRGPIPNARRGDLGLSTPFADVPPIAKLLWPCSSGHRDKTTY